MGQGDKMVKWAWSKLVEPAIIKTVGGWIALVLLGAIVFFASLKTVPGRTTKLEGRMATAEAKIATLDSTVREQGSAQKITAVTIQNTADRVNEIKGDIAAVRTEQARFNEMFQEFLLGQARIAARRRSADNP